MSLVSIRQTFCFIPKATRIHNWNRYQIVFLCWFCSEAKPAKVSWAGSIKASCQYFKMSPWFINLQLDTECHLVLTLFPRSTQHIVFQLGPNPPGFQPHHSFSC